MDEKSGRLRMAAYGCVLGYPEYTLQFLVGSRTEALEHELQRERNEKAELEKPLGPNDNGWVVGRLGGNQSSGTIG